MSEPPVITCAGRTDAGVHARGQVVHVDLPPIPYDGPAWPAPLNRQLAPESSCAGPRRSADDFDARRSATGRTYRYLVWNAPAPDPLLAASPGTSATRSTWSPCARPPTCCSARHDFRSFCRRRPGTDGSEPIVRRVHRARWSVDEAPEATDADGVAPVAGRRRLLRFEIDGATRSATRWCARWWPRLVEVGRGPRTRRACWSACAARRATRCPTRRPPGAVPGLGRLRPLGSATGSPDASSPSTTSSGGPAPH